MYIIDIPRRTILLKTTLNANGVEIGVIEDKEIGSFLCLTDIARYRNSEDPSGVISNWLRNRSTIDFLGLWESFHNADFVVSAFEEIKSQAGDNVFTMSPQKWIGETNSIGIITLKS